MPPRYRDNNSSYNNNNNNNRNNNYRQNNRPQDKIDREKTCPFLVRAFVSQGPHREDQQYSRIPIEDEVQIYTWRDTTLKELILLLRDTSPSLRSSPNARYSVKVVFYDPKRETFTSREFGTIFAKDLLDSKSMNSINGDRDNDNERMVENRINRSLHDIRYVIGDYIDIAYQSTGNGPNFTSSNRDTPSSSSSILSTSFDRNAPPHFSGRDSRSFDNNRNGGGGNNRDGNGRNGNDRNGGGYNDRDRDGNNRRPSSGNNNNNSRGDDSNRRNDNRALSGPRAGGIIPSTNSSSGAPGAWGRINDNRGGGGDNGGGRRDSDSFGRDNKPKGASIAGEGWGARRDREMNQSNSNGNNNNNNKRDLPPHRDDRRRSSRSISPAGRRNRSRSNSPAPRKDREGSTRSNKRDEMEVE